MTLRALSRAVVLAALVLPLCVGSAQAADLKNVLLLRPDDDHPFWVLFEKAMRAACNDLGCNVAVQKAGWDHFKMIEQLDSSLKQGVKPDVVFFQSYKKNGADIIKMLEKAEVNGFMINAGLDEAQLAEMGAPREKYKHWIGQMMPDDQGAGRLTAEILYQNAKKKNLAVDGKVRFVAIEGNAADGASIARLKGLKETVAAHADLELLQVVAGKWETELSHSLAGKLMQRYPQAPVIWAAGDTMAQGVISAIEEAKKVPGKDILTAGVDWDETALTAIKNGKLEADAGGHFMEGAWAVVVVHDYMAGIDFAKDGSPSLASRMGMLTADNLAKYTKKFGTQDFEQIDFKKLSKKENPKLKAYDFDMTKLLD